MPPAEFDQTSVTIAAPTQEGDAAFRATGRKLVFDGFMKVAGVSSEDQLLPDLAESQRVAPIEINPTQHFTQPPPRFTEASLVKALEQPGIGRPSTYAAIIDTIQRREYVEQIDRRFYATMLGMVVTDKLIQAFPDIMDVKFTAGMEGKLDEIEEEHKDWVKLLRDFYGPFHENVEGAIGKLEHAGGKPSPYKCAKCGKPMVYRISKGEFFLACSDTECKTFQSVDRQGVPKMREVSEFKCPKCGRDLIKRKGRFGEFLGCSGYSVKNEKGEPSCDVIINLDKEGKPLPPKVPPIKTTVKCEKCGSHMVLRDSKRGPFLGCSTFPKCRSTKMAKKLAGDDLQAGRGAAAAAEGGRRQGAGDGRQDHRRDPRRRRPGPPVDHRHRHRLRRVRQADGAPQGPPRLVPRVQRLPQVQEHRRGPGQAGGRTGLERRRRPARERQRPSRRRRERLGVGSPRSRTERGIETDLAVD